MCAVDLEREDIKCERDFSQLDEKLINKEKDSSCFTCRWNPYAHQESSQSKGCVLLFSEGVCLADRATGQNLEMHTHGDILTSWTGSTMGSFVQ